MRRIAARIVLCAILAGGLAACEVSDDPSKGGFISGASNLATGGYEKRVQDKEQELQSQRVQQDQLATRAAEIRRKREEVARALAQAEDRFAELERRFQQLLEKLTGARGDRATDQVKLSKLEAMVAEVREAMHQAREHDRSVDQSSEDVEQISGVLDSMASLVEELGAESGF